ncbi:MAG: metal ABC transporter permease [Verrucomicrobiota bacterium]|nr:metal ABC transporter permease [Verrucomicrobiota bacterium]
MMETWLIPFSYTYMIKAMMVSALIGGVCAILSCFMTLKGWSLMGDALSHSIVPGVSIAYIIGLPFSVGAFVAGILAAGGMAFVKSNTRIREDAVIGIVFTTFFAFGLLLISLFPSNVSLKSIVFGNILGISDEDIWQVVWISGVTLLVIGLKWKDLLLYCFDANHARSMGINADFLHMLFLTLMAATAVAALQTVGACLVVAMLVTPGATAYLLTDRFSTMLAIACTMGVMSSLVGVYVSYYFNGSTGGCIVVLQTLIFIGVFVFSRKYGVLSVWLKRRRVIRTLSKA